jgi:hypothetical protein
MPMGRGNHAPTCRSVRARVFFVLVVRGHPKRTKWGQVACAGGVLGVFLCGHLSDFRVYLVCSRLLEMADFRNPLRGFAGGRLSQP